MSKCLECSLKEVQYCKDNNINTTGMGGTAIGYRVLMGETCCEECGTEFPTGNVAIGIGALS